MASLEPADALFASLLASETEPVQVRCEAARCLRRSGSQAAVQHLVDGTRIGDPRVLASVLTALGQVGGIEVVDVLLEAERGSTGRTARIARFTAALLCHQAGIDRVDLPPIGPLSDAPAGRTRPIEFTRATPARSALRGLAAPRGLAFATDVGYGVRCGRGERLLLLDRRYTEPDGVGKIGRRPALVGAVADRDEEDGEHSITWFLLTSPVRGTGGVDVRLCRPTGEAVFAGTATVDGETAQFSVRTVVGSRAEPVEISGRFGGGGLDVITARAGAAPPMRRSTVEDRERGL